MKKYMHPYRHEKIHKRLHFSHVSLLKKLKKGDILKRGYAQCVFLQQSSNITLHSFT